MATRCAGTPSSFWHHPMPQSTPHPCAPQTKHCANNKDKRQPMLHHSTHHQPRFLSVVMCVPTHSHTSMLLCRTVCPTHSHCVQLLSPHYTTQRLCCFHPSPLVSCVRPTHSTTSTPHHTRFQCPFSQCATSLHHPAQHKIKHAMCCLSLSSKHPNTHSKPLGCSMLSWSCSIHCPSAAVPL